MWYTELFTIETVSGRTATVKFKCLPTANNKKRRIWFKVIELLSILKRKCWRKYRHFSGLLINSLVNSSSNQSVWFDKSSLQLVKVDLGSLTARYKTQRDGDNLFWFTIRIVRPAKLASLISGFTKLAGNDPCRCRRMDVRRLSSFFFVCANKAFLALDKEINWSFISASTGQYKKIASYLTPIGKVYSRPYFLNYIL